MEYENFTEIITNNYGAADCVGGMDMKIAEILALMEGKDIPSPGYSFSLLQEMESKLRAMQELMPEILDFVEFAKLVTHSAGEIKSSMNAGALITKLGVWTHE